MAQRKQAVPEDLFRGLVDLYGKEQAALYYEDFREKVNAVKLISLDIDSREETAEKLFRSTLEYLDFMKSIPHEARLLLADLFAVNAESSKLSAKPYVELPPLFMAQAIRPQNYIMQIDAITNQLANLSGEARLRVGRRGNQPVLTTVTLDVPDHMKIEGGHALTAYDKSIINGVTSLMESGNAVFSIPMLYHAMTGKQNPSVDDALYDEIAGKLEKMRRMILTIDLTEENEARYITGEAGGELIEVCDLVLEGYLLPLSKVSGAINGKRAELYQIIQPPPLYTYSKMKRQLASVKISLLGAPVNNNSTTIPLKTYLLQRIELMKNGNNSITRNTILYESIYTELGAQESGKTKKARIREYTTKILEHFITQRYVKSYAEFKAGRSIAGVNIDL